MNTPFTRRAEAFAEALDRAAAGAPVDTAATAAGVAPLVFLAERLGSVPLRPVGMGPSFRDVLLAEAATTLAPASAAPTAPAPAAAASTTTSVASSGATVSALPTALTSTAAQLVAGALSLAVAVTGAGFAAERSVPGDAFYGLKKLVERTQRGLAGSALDEARALSDEASARLAELRRLLDGGPLDGADLQRVDQLVADLSAALDGVLDRLAAGDIPQSLLDELTATWNSLAELVPDLPATAQAQALGTLAAINNRLGALVDGASPVNGGVHPTPNSAVPVGHPTTAPSTAPSAGAPTTAPTPPVSPAPAPTAPAPAATPTGAPPSLPVTPTTLPTATNPTGVPSVPIVLPTSASPAEVPGPVVPLPELPQS